jgi:hypothetical protein
MTPTGDISQGCYELQGRDLCGYSREEIMAILVAVKADQEACVIELRGAPCGPIAVWSPDHLWEELDLYLAREWPQRGQGDAT